MRSSFRRRAATLAAGAAVVLLLPLAARPAEAAPVTPGDFTGYGFDQCVAPAQPAMDAWLRSSPYWAVGIYTSGDSRACRTQPNLTPAWVSTQLRNGWRLLPITLGPQASCNPRFPRYRDDVRIDPSPTDRYRTARRQGRAEAAGAVAAAQALGIGAGSTLWYDMEAFDITDAACRESALWFLHAWTRRLHGLGYVSGVYSSAASGIKALDDARVLRPGVFTLPDQLWIARWDGQANTSTSYLRDDGWLPGGRVKQYQGDHQETWGGVTITIDRNWLDLGRGSTAGPAPTHCGGVRLTLAGYPTLRRGATGSAVSAAQCLLVEAGRLPAVTGAYDDATATAVRALRSSLGITARDATGRRVWTALLSRGSTRLVKYGGAGEHVRRLQRALNAGTGAGLDVTGVYEQQTTDAVRAYQQRVGLPASGVATEQVWSSLQRGILS